MADGEVKPFTTEEIDWLRPRHYRDDDRIRCHWCSEDWPCNTARFIVTVDGLVAIAQYGTDMQRLNDALREYDRTEHHQ